MTEPPSVMNERPTLYASFFRVWSHMVSRPHTYDAKVCVTIVRLSALEEFDRPSDLTDANFLHISSHLLISIPFSLH